MRAEVVGLLTDPEQALKPFSYVFDLLESIEGPDAVGELKLPTVGEKDCGLRCAPANFGGDEVFLDDGRTIDRTIPMVKACYDDGTLPTWVHAIGFVPKTYLPPNERQRRPRGRCGLVGRTDRPVGRLSGPSPSFLRRTV